MMIVDSAKAAAMGFSGVEHVSDCFIKPTNFLLESCQPSYLSPFDLAMASINYMQKGFLFAKPPSFDADQKLMQNLLLKLKESLSLTLDHFYPLAGRLETAKLDENLPDLGVYVDCSKGPGARFIHASARLSMDDIVSPTVVPGVVRSFFDHEDSINYDGRTQSLLTIQVTELIDGIFIGCSMNHMIGDGTSLWHFLSTFSEVFESGGRITAVSRPPTFDKLFPTGHGPLLSLPFAKHYYQDQETIISRDEGQPKVVIRERFFHFSSELVAKLKAKANAECDSTNPNKKISSLQAISAHVWRCITRCRSIPPDQTTIFKFAVSNRSRLIPPVSENNVGNYLTTAKVTVSCRELLERSLGWAAGLLHEAVNNQTDKSAREYIESWREKPLYVARVGVSDASNPSGILLGGSPRFNMYGTEFGLGKAVAIRSGSANKFDGKVTVNPGIEGGGSMDLEICLASTVMNSLEADRELMDAVSL